MKAELYWQETMYGDDFECCINVPTWMRDEHDSDDWVVSDLWFKAYDIQLDESDGDKELHRLGYKYLCEVMLRHNCGVNDVRLATRAVRTREEAERFFREYVEQLEETR